MNRREALKHTSLIMGYAISSSTIASLLSSCKNEPELGWQPELFTIDQAKTVTEMTECILPKTDTPGAKDLRLSRFIDRMAKELFSPEDQKQFLAGLQAFEQECQNTYSKSFIECTHEQQEEFLLQLDKKSPKFTPSIWGFPTKEPVDEPMSFYRTLKDLTLLGYFSSEEVGKHMLAYDPVPGAYLSCIPISEVGTTWTE